MSRLTTEILQQGAKTRVARQGPSRVGTALKSGEGPGFGWSLSDGWGAVGLLNDGWCSSQVDMGAAPALAAYPMHWSSQWTHRGRELLMSWGSHPTRALMVLGYMY